MVRSEFKKLNISPKEKHLIDVYSNTSRYLEIGTIGFDAMNSLLKYEIVQLEEVSYLPIQNSGFSQSMVKDKELKSIIPYLYFQNINQKNRPMQVFITHGLIRYKNSKNKEVFSPLMLMPVNIYFENATVYFQLISDPIENTVLLDSLNKEKNIIIPTVDKLDSLFNISKYFNYFEKYSEFKFELENYITFAATLSHETVLDFSKFSMNKSDESFLNENLYKDDNVVYYSKKYNRNQRRALHQALDGNSFMITGRLGTGKSTVLRDIAINAISEGKKVLYVSNMKETLNNFYDFLESKNMHYYVTKFSDSFASFHNGELVSPHTTYLGSAENFDDLLKKYDYIHNYQHYMTGRMLDYRFIDIINELILLHGHKKSILNIDDLSDVYKFEYLELLEAVKNIKANLELIGNFKNSVWKEIPIINDIRYPNQVISLVNKVKNGFQQLQKYKEELEGIHGFKEIGNYAYLKNVIHNFKNLHITEVPKSWYDRKSFDSTKSEYHNLKTLIFTLQEIEYELSIKYDSFDKFDIMKEVETLEGDFFTENDIDKLNKIINDRLNIVVMINKATVQVDIFQKSYQRLKKLLNFDFDLDREHISEILKLAKIILETNINPIFIKTIIDGKYNEVSLEATKALSNYLQYNLELEHLFDSVPLLKFGSIDETVSIFENYSKDIKVRRVHRRIIDKLKLEDETGFNNVYKAIDRYHELKELIKIEVSKFNELLDYHPDQVYLDDYTKVYEFIESIQNLKIKSRIIKFLKKLDDLSNKNYHKTFDHFQKSYEKISSLYDQLLKYEFLPATDEFIEKIEDIQKINNYIKRSFHSNDELYSLKKINTEEYIKAEDYYNIRESFRKIDEIKQELKTNKDFQFLFGNMYNTYNTDLNKLSKMINAFRLYSDCFLSEEDVVKSLNSENYIKITRLIDMSTIAVDDLNEVFKLYFKIFRNSVSRFYYAEFEDNINYLEELLNNKETLIIYLRITDNLQVLAKYQLYKFIEYIVYLKDFSTLVNDFKYTYLTNVRTMYLEKHPELIDYINFEKEIKNSIELENEIIDAVEDRIFRKIKKRSGTRFSLFGVSNLDYSGYVRKSNSVKHLFLTNTLVLNNFLNIKDYDLILIDDAHIFDANEYAYALEGDQVIVAGETQLQEAVASNLISRMSLSRGVTFDYRYSVMPKSLKNFTRGLSAPIYSNYYQNYGHEIITKNIYEYIVSLFKDSKNIIINLFVQSFDLQRMIYDEVTNLLLASEFNSDEVFQILSNQLNITDLKVAYILNADYNILFLESYYEYDEDYVVANMVDNLLLVRSKLVIYDSNDYLNSSINTNFLIELNNIINQSHVFMPPELSTSLDKLISVLEENKIICYASELCTFLIRVKSKLHGVTVYWDNKKTNYDILNEFRDIHYLKDDNIKKNIIVWAMELVDNFDGVVKRIIEEAYND